MKSLYAAATEEGRWAEALQQLAEFVGAEQIILYSAGIPPDAAQFFWASSSIPLDTQVDYARHYWQFDPWHRVLHEHPDTFASGTVQIDYDIVDKSAFRRSVFRHEFLGPLDIYHACGSVVNAGALADLPRIHVNLFRSARADDFADENAARLAALVPHLQSALKLSYTLGRSTLDAPLAEALIERAPSALFVVDASGRVLRSNERARTLVASGDGLLLGREGELQTRDPAQRVRLRTLVAAAARTSTGEGAAAGGAIMLAAKDGGTVSVSVVPLCLDDAWRSVAPRAAAVVIASAWHDQAEAARRALARAFGLTRAECRAAAGIAEGLSVKEIADRERLPLDTVRSQVKNVYRKAGVRRQADLVRLVMALPSLA